MLIERNPIFGGEEFKNFNGDYKKDNSSIIYLNERYVLTLHCSTK